MFGKKDLSDARIVRQVLAGNRDAFGVLVERHLDVVHAVAYAQTRNHADAEDVAQEAFLEAFRSLDQLRSPKRFCGWLVTIARNRCNKLHHHRQREATVVADAARETATKQPDFDSSELRAILRYQIEQLKPEFREVLMLHYFAGKSGKEIAAILEISHDAVRKRIERARTALGQDILEHATTSLAPERIRKERVGAILAAVAMLEVSWLGAGAAAAVGGAALIAKIGTAITVTAVVVAGVMFAAANQTKKSVQEDNAKAVVTAPSSFIERDAYSSENSRAALSGDADEPSRPQEAMTATSDTEAPTLAPNLRPDIEDVLGQPISLLYEDTHLTDILGFIEASFGIYIVVDDRAVLPKQQKQVNPYHWTAKDWELLFSNRLYSDCVTDGMFASLDFENVPVSQLLDETLASIGLSYTVRPDHIWVSTANKIRASDKSISSESSEQSEISAELKAALAMPFSLTARDIHVADVLDRLASFTDVTTFIDYSVVLPSADHIEWLTTNVTLPNPRDLSPELVTLGFLPKLRVTEVQLGSALRAMLTPMGLDYSVENGFIWISTPKRIQQNIFADGKPYSSFLDERHMSLLYEDTELFPVFEFAQDFVKREFLFESSIAGLNEDAVRLPYVRTDSISMRTLLNSLLRPKGLDFVEKDDKIWIASTEYFTSHDILREDFTPVTELAPLAKQRAAARQAAVPEQRPETRHELTLNRFLRWADGTLLAELTIDLDTTKSYLVGESFARYTLVDISEEAGTCVVLDEVTRAKKTLRLSE